MQYSTITLPGYNSIRSHIIDALSMYWPQGKEYLLSLPVKESYLQNIQLPLQLAEIDLPVWANEAGVNGKILVPAELCEDWKNVDWWMAAFLLLESWHERVFESNNGTIHSYSFRLKNWDTRAWDHAWVNRIGLLLRKWAANENTINEASMFGNLPAAHFIMTHDVDAVNKTMAIRFKQSAFNVFNGLRSLTKGKISTSFKKISKAATFFFGNQNWWQLDATWQLEKQYGIKSIFNFYADTRKKTVKRWLFDPGYSVNDKRVSSFIKNAAANGWTIGLHPAFDSWCDAALIGDQRKHISAISGKNVTTCRQHWLRFSWQHTWTAQQKAGLIADTTLMFNDRSGFRVSAALQWKPWNTGTSSSHNILTLPTVIMDSHLFDYKAMNENERCNYIKKWMNEVQAVGGTVALLWHPHTLAIDYGWGNTFEFLLKEMKSRIVISTIPNMSLSK